MNKKEKEAYARPNVMMFTLMMQSVFCGSQNPQVDTEDLGGLTNFEW